MKAKVSNAQEYIELFPQWKDFLTSIYRQIQKHPFEEHIKWGAPCFTYNGTNLVGLVAFKNHCAVWFHKGSLLSDPDNILVNAQPGKTKLLRQWRFAGLDNTTAVESQVDLETLNRFLKETIDIEIN